MIDPQDVAISQSELTKKKIMINKINLTRYSRQCHHPQQYKPLQWLTLNFKTPREVRYYFYAFIILHYFIFFAKAPRPNQYSQYIRLNCWHNENHCNENQANCLEPDLLNIHVATVAHVIILLNLLLCSSELLSLIQFCHIFTHYNFYFDTTQAC